MGAKYRSSPKDKVVLQERIDKNHTKVVYLLDSENEKNFLDKLFAKKGLVE
jgi:hypothetical protein